MTEFPDHSEALKEAYGTRVHDLLERAHWQTASTVVHVAGGDHQYNVIGNAKDDLSEGDFFLLVSAIKLHGRREEWHAPEGFYSSGRRPKYRNHYLYVRGSDGELRAYWYTKPGNAPHMLNRELVSYQAEHPTRRALEVQTRMEIGEDR